MTTIPINLDKKIKDIYNSFNQEPFYVESSAPGLRFIGWKNNGNGLPFMDYAKDELTIYSNNLKKLPKEILDSVTQKLDDLGLLEKITEAGIKIKD